MSQFIKAQGSSLIATGVDFLCTILLKEVFGVWYVAANILGVISGGVTNFFINKKLVFVDGEKAIQAQALRYGIVWLGNLILNATGVWLFTKFGSFNYIVSKIIVSLIVGWTYNYFLQKNFVFK